MLTTLFWIVVMPLILYLLGGGLLVWLVELLKAMTW